jgi:two-component system response regulator MprA
MDQGEAGHIGHLVLLVDDDARTVRRLAKMLRQDGFDVEVITDGRLAFERVTRTPVPHVLVTELVLPNVDGMAVAREARRHVPSLPVVVMTGYPHLVGKATDLAPQPAVMTKPVDYDHLVNLLRTTMGTSVL